MTKFSSILAALFAATLLLFCGASAVRGADGHGSSSTTVDPGPKSTSNVAFMDLTLTTRNDTEGEISVDEAFSLYFRSGARSGWDRYDASKIFPRGERWAAIAFTGTKFGDDVLKAQESRPYRDSVQTVDIALVQKHMPAATYTISVDQWYSVPSHWSLRLRSAALDTTFVIDGPEASVSFTLGPSGDAASTSSSSPGRPEKFENDPQVTQMQLAGSVGPASSTLPVELASFTGTMSGTQAALEWHTASETNNSGFVIQHRRDDSNKAEVQWARVGFVRGQGTTDQLQHYQFQSTDLATGTHFFRLKQLDHDGTAHLSDAVKIVRVPNGTVELTTAPNPFASQLSVRITPRSSGSAQIRLVDLLGRVVYSTGSVDLQANVQTQIQIDGRRLSSGTYMLRVKGDAFTATRRVTHVR